MRIAVSDVNFNSVTILIAEDDDGHAELIRLHLQEAGMINPILRFKNGQDLLDFLFRRHGAPPPNADVAYLLLLDLRMPKVDGIDVLRQMKADAVLHKIPVIILTTTDDPCEIDACYALGCNTYITKPVEFGAFSEVLKRLGLFLQSIKVPVIREDERRSGV